MKTKKQYPLVSFLVKENEHAIWMIYYSFYLSQKMQLNAKK